MVYKDCQIWIQKITLFQTPVAEKVQGDKIQEGQKLWAEDAKDDRRGRPLKFHGYPEMSDLYDILEKNKLQ